MELAQEITRDQETPYDKALAITSWLRNNIEYSRETESPPEDVEPLDWFLFDYKVGYCNFYASAQVIMLRSLGIPARLAAGYARGEFDSDTGLYSVMGEDSHSWPEVYFPGYGWVEFEPTVSQSILTRPEEAEDSDDQSRTGESNGDDNQIPGEDPFQPDPGDEEFTGPVTLSQSLPYIQVFGLVLMILLVAGLWIRLNPSTWIGTRKIISSGFVALGMEPPSLFSIQETHWDTYTGRVYASWSTWLSRLRLANNATETAYERLHTFNSALPDSAEDASVIVEAYSQERFGELPVDEGDVRQSWRRLRGTLWLAWIWRITARWRKTT